MSWHKKKKIHSTWTSKTMSHNDHLLNEIDTEVITF